MKIINSKGIFDKIKENNRQKENQEKAKPYKLHKIFNKFKISNNDIIIQDLQGEIDNIKKPHNNQNLLIMLNKNKQHWQTSTNK